MNQVLYIFLVVITTLLDIESDGIGITFQISHALPDYFAF